MTDCFALLVQPRRPWLDLETLEQKYRELARATHPDRSAHSANDFAELNNAYRTLGDPKSRLEHLLALEGHAPSSATTEVPADLANLFMQIAPALRANKKEKLAVLAEELTAAHESALDELHQLNERWATDAARALNDAENLHRRFAFLGRWKTLLEEHRFSYS